MGVPPRIRDAGDVPHGSGDTSLDDYTASMETDSAFRLGLARRVIDHS